MAGPIVVYDFNKESNTRDWVVVDDGVMGGLSQGNYTINEEGHGVFSGSVSLENNGGFSSIRLNFRPENIEGYKKVAIRLKGDGKRYQFRVKSNSSEYYSYIGYFKTTGEWETVEIKLKELYPSFRGMKLDLPNYPGETLGEIVFLIGNNKAEDFQLMLDKIELR